MEYNIETATKFIAVLTELDILYKMLDNVNTSLTATSKIATNSFKDLLLQTKELVDLFCLKDNEEESVSYKEVYRDACLNISLIEAVLEENTVVRGSTAVGIYTTVIAVKVLIKDIKFINERYKAL